MFRSALRNTTSAGLFLMTVPVLNVQVRFQQGDGGGDRSPPGTKLPALTDDEWKTFIMKMPGWEKDFPRVDALGAVLVACKLERFRSMREKSESIHKHFEAFRRSQPSDPVWDLVLSQSKSGLESIYAPRRFTRGDLVTYQGDEPHARTEHLATKLQRQEASFASDQLAKENFSISAVISAPRAGKSRLLDEFTKKCFELRPLEETKEFTASERDNFGGFFPIPISCNSSDAEATAVDGRHPVASFFWRALHFVLCSKLGTPMDYHPFRTKYPGWTRFTSDDFFSMLPYLWPDSRNSRVVFIVDEFHKLVETTQWVIKQDFPEERSKERDRRLVEVLSLLTTSIYNSHSLVVSGYTPAFIATFAIASGRPMEKHFIPLVDHATRRQYSGFNDKLEHYYGSKWKIPKYLYEVLKSSAGLMGRWVEVCDETKYFETRELPTTITNFETQWRVVVIFSAKRLHPLAVRYFTSWATNDKVDEALDSMANDPTRLVVYEKGGSIVPHPYPFALLANKMEYGQYMGYILVMEKIANTLTTTDGSVSPTVKGDVLERTVCLALAVKAEGMGTSGHFARNVVDVWLGESCFGDARPKCKVKSKALAKYLTPSRFIDYFIDHLKEPVTSFPYVAKGKSVEVKRALKTNAILYPSDPNNRGADVISVWDVVGGGLFLTMVKCEFTEEVDSGRFTRKVLDALSSEFQANAVKWNVKHIAFCVVARGAVSAPATTSYYGKGITERIASWGGSGITVTIHVRQGAEGLRQFLTPVLYHLMPESEGSPCQSTAVPPVKRGRAAVKQKRDKQLNNKKAGPTKSKTGGANFVNL